ncbi:transposable element Tcb2 transposase [Trichonephila clavipes]|nr:transposable element Tcb2 transposase [Trichonephila clavipes]
MNALEGQYAQMRGKIGLLFDRFRTTPTVSLSTIQRTIASLLSPVVLSTLSRHLAEARLHSQRPLRRLPLAPQHRRNRLQGCRSQSSCLPSDCHLISFNDESSFTFKADDHRFHVRRDRGDRTQLAFAYSQWRTQGGVLGVWTPPIALDFFRLVIIL